MKKICSECKCNIGALNNYGTDEKPLCFDCAKSKEVVKPKKPPMSKKKKRILIIAFAFLMLTIFLANIFHPAILRASFWFLPYYGEIVNREEGQHFFLSYKLMAVDDDWGKTRNMYISDSIYHEFRMGQIIEKKRFSNTIRTLRHTKIELERLKRQNQTYLDSLVANSDSIAYFTSVAEKVFSLIGDHEFEIASIFCTPDNEMLKKLSTIDDNQDNGIAGILGNFMLSAMKYVELDTVEYKLEAHGDTLLLFSTEQYDQFGSKMVVKKSVSFVKIRNTWLFSDFETSRER